MIWTFSRRTSQVMKYGVSCVIPKVNDNPPLELDTVIKNPVALVGVLEW
jgi:hypothetical protein